MKKQHVIFLSIFLVGLFLRFYRLGDIPVGLHRDEAFFGYNAYSILHTAKDMSGNFLPLHLQSFLFSPAGYSYLSVPFIFLFDLSSFSVRFASALFGSLMVLLCYFLSLEIFANNRNKESIGLLSALCLAVSPWNINLARTATESTVVVFFITLATLIFIKGFKNKKFYLLFISFVFYFLTLFIYQAPRAFLPIFIPVILVFSLTKIKEIKNNLKLLFLFLCLIILPVVLIVFSNELSLRIRTLSVFSNSHASSSIQEYISTDGISSVNTIFTRVFHNKIEAYSAEVIKNYFKHFSYDFLFTDSGLPDRYRIPSMGIMYVFDLPLLLFGIWKIIGRKQKSELFLLIWIALAPIGSALTFDDIPNLQRTLIVFPALSMVIGVGAFYLISYLLNYRNTGKYVLLGLLFIVFYSFGFYIHQYYVHASAYNPWYRQDGYKQLVARVNNFLPGYSRAVITNRESAPSVFFLFYLKYSPSKFQKESAMSNKNTSDSTSFDKFYFSEEECPFGSADIKPIVPPQKNVLYVNSGNCKAPQNAKILDIIKRTDGSEAFEILSLNE